MPVQLNSAGETERHCQHRQGFFSFPTLLFRPRHTSIHTKIREDTGLHIVYSQCDASLVRTEHV